MLGKLVIDSHSLEHFVVSLTEYLSSVLLLRSISAGWCTSIRKPLTARLCSQLESWCQQPRSNFGRGEQKVCRQLRALASVAGFGNVTAVSLATQIMNRCIQASMAKIKVGAMEVLSRLCAEGSAALLESSIDMLSDTDRDVKRVAVRILPDLLRQRGSCDTAEHRIARDSNAYSYEDFINFYGDGDAQTCWAWSQRAHSKREVVSLLKGMLERVDDREAVVRGVVLVALGQLITTHDEIIDENLASHMALQLEDPHPYVQEVALKVLTSIAKDRVDSVDFIINVLRDRLRKLALQLPCFCREDGRSEHVRMMYIQALVQLSQKGDKQTIDLLCKRLAGANGSSREAAEVGRGLTQLCDMSDLSLVWRFASWLKEPRDKWRAVTGLEHIASVNESFRSESIDATCSYLGHSDCNTREFALIALQRFSARGDHKVNKAAIAQLRRSSETKDHSLRLSALYVLHYTAEEGDQTTVEAIATCLHGGSWETRLEARNILIRLVGEDSMKQLRAIHAPPPSPPAGPIDLTALAVGLSVAQLARDGNMEGAMNVAVAYGASNMIRQGNHEAATDLIVAHGASNMIKQGNRQAASNMVMAYDLSRMNASTRRRNQTPFRR